MIGLLLLLLSLIVIIFIAGFCLWFYVEEKNAKRIMQLYDDNLKMYNDDLKRLREQGIIK